MRIRGKFSPKNFVRISSNSQVKIIGDRNFGFWEGICLGHISLWGICDRISPRRLWTVIPRYLRSPLCNPRFLFVNLYRRSPLPVGNFENSLDNPPDPRAYAPASVRRFVPLPGLRSGPWARRVALGTFKIPSGHRVSRRRFPPKNPNLLLTYDKVSFWTIILLKK